PDPKWAPLARYNLGLSAQRAGRPQQAMEYFGEAHRTTADPNLRALAATAFERLRGAPPSPQTSAVISLAGGYDSNATLSPDAAVDAQASWRLDAGGELRGRYQFGHFAGGGGFEYLDGRQQRLSADAGFALASALLRVGYQLELNDRRDLQQGSEFFSASPT